MAEETKATKETAEAKPKAAARTKKAAGEAPAAKARTRKPKAEGEQSSRESTRKLREGLVVSNKMDKTVVVLIERRTQHPIYGKVVIRSNKFKAHDIIGCDIGDRVEIMETRPMSKDKRWRVTQILEKVK